MSEQTPDAETTTVSVLLKYTRPGEKRNDEPKRFLYGTAQANPHPNRAWFRQEAKHKRRERTLQRHGCYKIKPEDRRSGWGKFT